MVVSRFEVYLLRKRRPCVLLSPDEMNHHLATVIVAPMTARGREYPTRVPVRFRKKKGQVVLEQLRTVAKNRLGKRLGRIDRGVARKVLALLGEMFAR